MAAHNLRLDQIAHMFSYITGVSYEEALVQIRRTETGRAIENRSATVLYEQQTNNLYVIAEELRKLDGDTPLLAGITVPAIVGALEALDKLETDRKEGAVLKFDGILDLDSYNEKVLHKRQQMLMQQQQNRLSEKEVREC